MAAVIPAGAQSNKTSGNGTPKNEEKESNRMVSSGNADLFKSSTIGITDNKL